MALFSSQQLFFIQGPDLVELRAGRTFADVPVKDIDPTKTYAINLGTPTEKKYRLKPIYTDGGSINNLPLTTVLDPLIHFDEVFAGSGVSDAGIISIAGLTGTGYVKATATDVYTHQTAIPQADITNLSTDLSQRVKIASQLTATTTIASTDNLYLDNGGTDKKIAYSALKTEIVKDLNTSKSIGTAIAGGATTGASVSMPVPTASNVDGDFYTVPSTGFYSVGNPSYNVKLATNDRLVLVKDETTLANSYFVVQKAGENQIASDVPNIPIVASATQVAITSTDVQGAISELSAAIKANDDILSFANLLALPATGLVGKVYIAEDTDSAYVWDVSTLAYKQIGNVSTTPITATATKEAITGTTIQTNLDSISTSLSSKTWKEFTTTLTGAGATTIALDALVLPTGFNGSVQIKNTTTGEVWNKIAGNTSYTLIEKENSSIIKSGSTITVNTTLIATTSPTIIAITGNSNSTAIEATLPLSTSQKYPIYLYRNDYNPTFLVNIKAQGTDKIHNIATSGTYPLNTGSSVSDTYMLIPVSGGYVIN